MFGISLSECIIILIVMILALKPKDFISIIKSLFDLVDKLKSLCRQIEKEIRIIDLLKDYQLHEVSEKKSSNNDTSDNKEKLEVLNNAEPINKNIEAKEK